MKVIKVEALRELTKDVDEYIETGIIIGERPVFIKRYFPIEDKIDILTSFYNGVYKSGEATGAVIEILRKVNFIKEYTNINLPKDYMEAYNLIQSTGIFQQVCDKMDSIELKELKNIERLILKDIKKDSEENSIIDLLQSIIPSEDATKSLIAEAKEAVNEIDKDKLKEIQNTLSVM